MNENILQCFIKLRTKLKTTWKFLKICEYYGILHGLVFFIIWLKTETNVGNRIELQNSKRVLHICECGTQSVNTIKHFVNKVRTTLNIFCLCIKYTDMAFEVTYLNKWLKVVKNGLPASI